MQVVVVHSSVERKTEYCGVKLGWLLEGTRVYLVV